MLVEELTKLQNGHVISSLPQSKKDCDLDVGKGSKKPYKHLDPEFRQLSTRKKIGSPIKFF